MPDDSAVLGELAEEFSARVRQGQMPEIEDYARQHPALAERIRALFPTLMLLEGMAAGRAPGEAASALASPADIAAGTMFGNFRVEREIGRGGMGVVYEATHLALNKRVALKVLPIQGSREASQLERFLREAQTAAGLHHTNIVPVFDVGQVNGIPYYAMQYIEGRGLDRVLRDDEVGPACRAGPVLSALEFASGASGPARQAGPTESTAEARTVAPSEPSPPAAQSSRHTPCAEAPHTECAVYTPPSERAQYFRWVAEAGIQAAGGLAHAHQRGVIHRDIKPSNLILDELGVIWITDFGLARRSDDPNLTRSGAIMGTPRYMSPEQAEAARKPVDHRTDIYSLGATLYELLTRRPAFDGATPLDIVMQILDRAPVSPRRLNPAVPRDLETIVLKAMAKRPEDRYQTAAELAEDLGRSLRLEPIRARRIGPVGRIVRWCRRNPLLAAVSGSAAAVILILSGIFYWRLLDENTRTRAALIAEKAALQNAQEERALAEKERERAQAAEEDAKDNLCRGLLEQARVVRISGQPGRRWHALELIEEAEKLRAAVRGLERRARLPAKGELRQEAVAALMLEDAQCILDRPGNLGMPPVLSASGRVAGEAWVNTAKKAPEGGIRVLDLTSGKALFEKTDRDLMFAKALSADGTWLAHATQEQQVRLWKIPEDKPRFVLDFPGGKTADSYLTTLEFSPDSRRLAGFLASIDGATAVVWDLKSRKGKILGQTKEPSSLHIDFSASSRLVAYAAKEKKVVVVDLDTDQRTELDLPAPAIGNIAFSPDDRWLAVACGDRKNSQRTVVVWDLKEMKEKTRWPIEGLFEFFASALAFSRDGTRLAVGHQMGNILIADPFSGKELLRLTAAHKLPVLRMAWQPDGRHLTSTAFDGSLKVWRWSPKPARSALSLGDRQVSDLLFSPDGKWLALENRKQKKTSLIERSTGKVVHEFPLRGRLLFRPDGKQLAVIGRAELFVDQARVFDLPSGAEVLRREAKKEFWSSAAFSSDNHLLVVRGGANPDRVWDLTADRLLWQAPAEPKIERGSLSPDGRYFMGVPNRTRALPARKDSNPPWILWELPGGRQVGAIEQPDATMQVQGPKFSHDGRWLAYDAMALPAPLAGKTENPARGSIRVLGLPSLKQHLDIPQGSIPGYFVFSADSKLLAIMGLDGAVAFWDLERGQELFRWTALTQPPEGLAFTPEGDLACLEYDSATLQVLHLSELRRQLGAIGLGW